MKYLLCSLLCVSALACADDETPVPDASSGLGGAAGSAGSAGFPGGKCDVKVEAHAQAPSAHVTECSTLTDDSFNSNPPSSGNHYPVWAAFKTYTQPIPRGYYVHSLEHGAVIFFYNCPDGCPAEVAALQAVADSLPVDPTCLKDDPQGVQRRIIILPEPRLPTRFAAAAWGWTLRSSCVDQAAFDSFAREHYDDSYEKICYAGTDVVAKGIAPGCGD